MTQTLHLFPIALVALAVLAVPILLALMFRVVVSTNDVHIVQSSGSTVSYGGRAGANGNTYYRWPSWVPRFGVKTIILPVSVFSQELNAYAAYDKDRVPFSIDIMAFFRIVDSNVAAERISSVEELHTQLEGILQGAVRTTLASYPIDQILEGRSEFGEHFTKEVDVQLREWGVQTVKTIELMDIRDAQDSKVIANIMAKKKSFIEMQSRIEVAQNLKDAQMKEIEASRDVDMSKQEALQVVGIRTADQERDVGIANERSRQSVQEQAKITAEKDMAVRQVSVVRQAEINRDAAIVAAEQEKKTTVLVAEGKLQGTKLAAQGIAAEGEAKASAEKALQLAPVEAQIVLAREIGANESYQKYLISVRQVEAGQVVGVEQAKALAVAEIKVISNSGTVQEGVDGVSGLLSPRGGLSVGGMLEAFKNTPAGREVVDAIVGAATKTERS